MKEKLRKVNVGILAWAILLVIGVSIGCILSYEDKKENNIVLDKANNVDTNEEEQESKEVEEIDDAKESTISDTAKEEEVHEEAVVNYEEKQPKVEKKLEEKQQQKAPKTNNDTEKTKSNVKGVVTTYKSNKMGVVLTFPADWQNKYVVNETDQGIVVSYIFQHDYYFDYYGNKVSRGNNKIRFLFCIKDSSKLNQHDIDTIDGIRNVPKNKTIHGKNYIVGGPTDSLENNDPDNNEVNKLSSEIPGIVSSIKEF